MDLRRPLSPETVAAIDSGMDEYAVLVFRGQDISDEEQLAFSRALGPIESSIGGNITRLDQRRLGTDIADVSNLDQNQNIYARDDRRRLFNLGNRLWHSDSSFRAIPAKYSLLSARSIPADGPNTEYADMRAAYDALDDKIKAEVEGLICEHSLMYSRGQLGFTDFTEEEQQTFAPVRQVLVRTHPVTMRRSLFLASHAGNENIATALGGTYTVLSWLTMNKLNNIQKIVPGVHEVVIENSKEEVDILLNKIQTLQRPFDMSILR